MFHVQLRLNKSSTEFLLNMYVNKPFYMKKLAVETNIFEKRIYIKFELNNIYLDRGN